MNFPKISIVIPSYNQGQFLEGTIQSVIDQQYPNLELFIVDGGSTDNSVDIIRKYETQLAWWVSEKDKGQSEAINKGFARATGDIITWLCSDDFFTDNTLHKVAEHFSKCDSSVGLIHGGVTLLRDDKNVLDTWGYKDPGIERNLAGIAFGQAGAFVKKKYLDQIGGRVNEQLHYGMDYDLFCKLACICKFEPVKDIFAKVRLHHGSKGVAESHKFMGDWSRSFVNLCNNIGWYSLNERLRSTGVISEDVFKWNDQFRFTPDKEIIEKVDTEKLLFYHLCYVLKDLYWIANRPAARRLLAWLKRNYSVTQLKNEEKIPPIMFKLALPDPVLLLLKKLNRIKRRIL